MKIPDIKVQWPDIRDPAILYMRKAILERYGDDGMFNPIELMLDIERHDPSIKGYGLSVLIASCEKLHVKEVYDYYLSTHPDKKVVRYLLRYCNRCCDDSIVSYYLSLNPPSDDVLYIMTHLPACQRKDMILYYVSTHYKEFNGDLDLPYIKKQLETLLSKEAAKYINEAIEEVSKNGVIEE